MDRWGAYFTDYEKQVLESLYLSEAPLYQLSATDKQIYDETFKTICIYNLFLNTTKRKDRPEDWDRKYKEVEYLRGRLLSQSNRSR